GVLPSHSRTLTSGPSRCSSCRTGGGSNGHLGSRAMGYSGISVLSSVEFSTVPVIESSRRVRASCGGKRCRPEGLCDLPTAEAGLFGHVPADDSGDPARTFEQIGRAPRLNSSHVKISYAVICLNKKIESR